MLKDLFSNRLFIGALAIFVLCVGGSLLYMQHVQQQGAEYAAETQDRIAQWNEKQNPTTAEVPEGDTSQGGHWHGDEWHADPHETEVQPPTAAVREPVAPRRDGVEAEAPAMNLTYHAELLKSDPVEALRQQGKERGHWSADYLPDFPPDDMEAMEYARSEYHYIYYGHTIPVSEHGESPEFQRAAAENRRLYDAIDEKYASLDWDVRARNRDLKMLAWPSLEYDASRIDSYRDYTKPSLIVRSHMYPDLPELGETR